jgi:hypothetical protein
MFLDVSSSEVQLKERVANVRLRGQEGVGDDGVAD